MADNNLFVGKWLPFEPAEVEEGAEQPIIQFYKDGSCLIPGALLGKEGEDCYFYQVFENGMMKLEGLRTALYHCAMVGDNLTLTSMDGAAFTFTKVREEKRSFFKGKLADMVPAAEKEREPEPEREALEYEWKCPSCGKINQNYVGTCGCGESKPNDKLYNWREVHPELVKEAPAEEPAPAPEPVEEEKPKKPPVPEREPLEHEWKCPSCGKINQNYVGTCGCGEAKPNNKLFNWAEVHPELVKPEPVEEPAPEPEAVEEEKSKKPVVPEREPLEHEWKCPSCGKINQNYVGTCGCGAAKPNDKLFNWAQVHPELVKPEVVEKEPAPIAPEKKAKPKKEEPPVPERVPTENEWKCPSCGKINQNYVGTCGCGEGKPKAAPAPAPAPDEAAE